MLECFNNEDGLITATTRPETLLGDTALAYHPEDPRYNGLAGSTVQVPMVNREIKVITSTKLDPLFGTGILKVTPAHDFNDYEIGVESKLEMISVIGKDGKIIKAIRTLVRVVAIREGKKVSVELEDNSVQNGDNNSDSSSEE